MDKTWMNCRNKLRPEYTNGVRSFIKFASEHMGEQSKIWCPCLRCMNVELHSYPTVQEHLLFNGIMTSYTAWIHHGEQMPMNVEGVHDDDSDDEGGSVQGGLSDTEDNPHDELPELLEDIYRGVLMDDDLGDLGSGHGFDSVGQENVQKFEKLLKDAQRALYPGCTKFTLLSFVIKMLHVKVLNNLSNKAFNMVMMIMKDVIPESEMVPGSLYEAKKFLRELGLGYKSIHACKNDCVLFRKENENLENCPECGEFRYKHNDGKGKKIPVKVLRHLPLIPRLQRLFMSRKTAIDMRWHKEKLVDAGEFSTHPADRIEWKDFDRQYPAFAQESRNVRLGLATDGFNPFGNMSNSYSMWPVILMPYNLPPWKCMKEPFCMMSLLIPGPGAPGKEIDLYMQPLIEELKELWEDGVLTYDASKGETFRMHAALMWTINDFPAYGNLSGWSTKGYMACPTCNKDPSSQRLKDKIGYTGARRYLPENHTWRRSKLFNGKLENRTIPVELSGEQILEQLDCLTNVKFGKHPLNRKRKRLPEELNWTKKSILFELPYWKKLKLRHNLDVMHVEKNICDNTLGTVMGIDGKNKDTEKARMDLEGMKIRKELHLRKRADGSFEKPPAIYTLSLKERQAFCDFLKSVRFPDGYAANISSCVNTKDGKVSGLKSHDCHVILQRLLPIGVRGYLPKDICTTLFELGNFFEQLCAKRLRLKDLEALQDQIVLILCKMEKIFPPAFFDVMLHLAIHLPREAMLAGPVQYRWMYPIERY